VNRTAQPDDIIGSLLVRDGPDGPAVDAASYEPNHFYRVVTQDGALRCVRADDCSDRCSGVMRINDELQRVLMFALEEARQVEEGLAEDAQMGE
jgi:hypothetical protein